MVRSKLVKDFSRALADQGRAARARQEKRYLKSDLRHFGVGVPKIRSIARAWLARNPELTGRQLTALVRALWSTGWYEHRSLSVMLLAARVDALSARDVPFVEELLRRSKTWALVDELAPWVMGPLVERTPRLVSVLRRWSRDEDFWLRRAALLALLIPLRQGQGDFALFTELAVQQLDDTEFFIRKAIGWVLREVAKKRPALVKRFVRRYGSRMSGLTLREATKNL